MCNEKAIADTADLPNCKTVVYERLCEDPATAVRDLFGFAGLDWARQSEDFLRASTGRENSAYHSVFKNPRTSADKWRSELPGDPIARIEDITRRSTVMKHFGHTD